MTMAKLMEYRGYHAKVEYDPEDEILVGEVVGITDSLSFEATTTTEIVEMFHQSIDNYLEFCEKVGKKPDKEYSGTFNVRIQPDLHRNAYLKAQQEGVSLNRVVEKALKAYLLSREENPNHICPRIEGFKTTNPNIQLCLTCTEPSNRDISSSYDTANYWEKFTTEAFS